MLQGCSPALNVFGPASSGVIEWPSAMKGKSSKVTGEALRRAFSTLTGSQMDEVTENEGSLEPIIEDICVS